MIQFEERAPGCLSVIEPLMSAQGLTPGNCWVCTFLYFCLHKYSVFVVKSIQILTCSAVKQSLSSHKISSMTFKPFSVMSLVYYIYSMNNCSCSKEIARVGLKHSSKLCHDSVRCTFII